MHALHLYQNSRHSRQAISIDWLAPVKALALLAILLNHLVEEFGPGAWFTNPSAHWPDFPTRLTHLFPNGFPSPVSCIQFTGWLGDSAPGVFIFASGLGLTWSMLHKQKEESAVPAFFRRRAIRIYPLYITMHLIFLAGAVFVPDRMIQKISVFRYTLASPYTLLSMLGLRCTDELFFGFISPSWWFIWLILQLYLIFPLLYIFLRHKGIVFFLSITWLLTFISRALGVLYPQLLPYSLFSWMTGIFFGTRLAEFTAGMALAVLMKQHGKTVYSPGKIMVIALPVYLAGICCSIALPTTLFSNLLVTLGMAGLFYVAWQAFFRRSPFLSGILWWISGQSLAIYLFHQPPLKFTAMLFPDSSGLHLTAAIMMVLLSFPIAWLIQQTVDKTLHSVQYMQSWSAMGKIIFVANLAAIVCIVSLDRFSGWQHKMVSLGGGVLLVFLGLATFAATARKNGNAWLPAQWGLMCAVLVKIFFFPTLLGSIISCVLGILVTLSTLLFLRFRPTRQAAPLWGVIALVFCIGTGELSLGFVAPLSAGKWGELAALEAHPTRIYGLKPGKTVHLEYDDYDYVLRVNSMGLPGPERPLTRPTPDTLRIFILGDAFSMPEGLEYKDAYPALLEALLNSKLAPRPVQVINGGITGYGPVEESSQLRELAPLFKPDIVVYQFFVNEFSEVNTTPVRRRQGIGLEPLYSLQQINLIEYSQIIRHLGEGMYAITDHFIRNYADNSVLHRYALQVFHILEKMTGGWRYRNAQLQFYRKDDSKKLYGKKHLDKLSNYLRQIQQTCQETGAKLIIYFVPAAITVSSPEYIAHYPWDQNIHDQSIYDLNQPIGHLRKIAGKLGIDVVDLTQALKDNPGQPVYFPGSWHWNKEGHRAVAGAVFRDLCARGILRDPEK